MVCLHLELNTAILVPFLKYDDIGLFAKNDFNSVGINGPSPEKNAGFSTPPERGAESYNKERKSDRVRWFLGSGKVLARRGGVATSPLHFNNLKHS